MIIRQVRRLLALQCLAGIAVGAWAASGHPLSGATGRWMDVAILTPTAAVQIRPVARYIDLPMATFSALAICSALVAVVTVMVMTAAGSVIGSTAWFAVVDRTFRDDLASGLACVSAAGLLARKAWSAIR